MKKSMVQSEAIRGNQGQLYLRIISTKKSMVNVRVASSTNFAYLRGGAVVSTCMQPVVDDGHAAAPSSEQHIAPRWCPFG